MHFLPVVRLVHMDLKHYAYSGTDLLEEAVRLFSVREAQVVTAAIQGPEHICSVADLRMAVL